MRRAFLVLGPESSGTRLLTRILVEAGCSGSNDHYQWWDDHSFGDEELVVWRRSFPHAATWPDLSDLLNQLVAAGFERVVGLVTVRDHWAMACSQVLNRPVMNVKAAEAHIEEAYTRIFAGLLKTGIPYRVLTYENLVARPVQIQRWLYQELDLPRIPDVEVFDGNDKHYLGAAWLR